MLIMSQGTDYFFDDGLDTTGTLTLDLLNGQRPHSKAKGFDHKATYYYFILC